MLCERQQGLPAILCWQVSLIISYESDIDPDLNHRFSNQDLLMQYHFGLGVGHVHAHMFTSSYQSMSMDAQDEPVPESLSISEDVSLVWDMGNPWVNLTIPIPIPTR